MLEVEVQHEDRSTRRFNQCGNLVYYVKVSFSGGKNCRGENFRGVCRRNFVLSPPGSVSSVANRSSRPRDRHRSRKICNIRTGMPHRPRSPICFCVARSVWCP